MKKREHKPKEGSYNCGRWQPDEHQRFVEAILKFGNEWKQVQKYVKTRSSSQARSHAQKFFYKLKKANLLDINIELDKNSIKTLHDFANSLDAEKYIDTVKALNHIAFDRNSNENLQISLEKDINNSNKFIKNEDEIVTNSVQSNFIELEFFSDDKLVEINDEYYINFIEKQGKLSNLYEDHLLIEDSLKKKEKKIRLHLPQL